MNCDVCGVAAHGARLSARQVRAAVKAGFNPFTLGIVGEDVAKIVGRDQKAAFEAWSLVVFVNDTPWNLCARCEMMIQPFALLKDAADAPSPIPDDAFDRADWIYKELTKKQAEALAAAPRQAPRPAEPEAPVDPKAKLAFQIYSVVVCVLLALALIKAC